MRQPSPLVVSSCCGSTPEHNGVMNQKLDAFVSGARIQTDDFARDSAAGSINILLRYAMSLMKALLELAPDAIAKIPRLLGHSEPNVVK